MSLTRKEFVKAGALVLGNISLNSVSFLPEYRAYATPIVTKREEHLKQVAPPAEDESQPFSISARVAFLRSQAVMMGVDEGPTLVLATGIHNGAMPGGYHDVDRFLTDVDRLGFAGVGQKTFFKYDRIDEVDKDGEPKLEKIVKLSAEKRYPLFLRIQSETGLFDEKITGRAVGAMLKYYGDTDIPLYLQTGNEPELGNDETRGVLYAPAEYSQKLVIPSIKFLDKEAQGRVLYVTPPVAPDPYDPEKVMNGFTYPGFLQAMLSPIAEEFEPAFIERNICIGGNYYVFGKDQTPWEEITKLAIGVGYDGLGVFAKTVGTEFGLNQEGGEGRHFDLEETARINHDLLTLRMPLEISQIFDRGFLWIYNGGGIPDFRFAELVNDAGGYNPVAERIASIPRQ